MMFPILTEVQLPFLYILLPGQLYCEASCTFQSSRLLHADLCQVLGPLSEEEVVQSNRFIKLLYNFMVDGKPGKGQQEFEGWLPSTGNKTVDVGGV